MKKFVSTILLLALLMTSTFGSVTASAQEVSAPAAVEETEGTANTEGQESEGVKAVTGETSGEENSEEQNQQAVAVAASQEPDHGAEQGTVPETEPETIGEEGLLNYIYIESPYLESPGVQNIVVSYGDGTEQLENVSLVYESDKSGQKRLAMSEREQSMYLFNQQFESQDKGVYRVTAFCFTEDGKSKKISLKSVGVDALFGVDEFYPGYENAEAQAIATMAEDEGIAVASIDTTETKKVQNAVAQVLEESDAAVPAKARSSEGKYVVVLDPGHGGGDAGASGNGVNENDINYKIAEYCKEELEQYSGVVVYMTRTKNENPSIYQRVQIAKGYGAKLLVSLHNNASDNAGAHGAEVLCPNKNYNSAVYKEGQELSQKILNELVLLGITRRGLVIKSEETGKYPDGSAADWYGICRYSKQAGFTGIIVEHAFVSNANDVKNFLSSDEKLKKLGIADAKGIASYLGVSKGAWKSDSKGYWFEYADGTRPTSCWKKMEGYWYYFDKDGYRMTGWLDNNSKKYYLESDGKMVTGWKTIEGAKYYFESSGAMHTGWLNVNGNTYYLNGNGILQTGTFQVGNTTYRTDSTGAVYTGTGWKQLDGSWYYFDKTGAMKKGWLKSKNKWYYLKEDGKMATGFAEVGGKTYYLNGSGAMLTGWQKIDNEWYFFENSGAMKKGWLKSKNKWYYLKDNGKMATGFAEVGGKTYYLNGSGAMLTGWQKIDNVWYYFEKSGAMKKGWLKSKNKWYYLKEDGKMATGFAEVGGKTYYLNGSGAMLTGWQKIDNVWYYFEKSGAMKKGWLKSKNKWYYLKEDGKMATGFIEEGGKTYYLNGSGAMLTGWQKIDNAWYYFEKSGAMKKGWLDYKTKRYYLKEDGKMATGRVTVDGKEYEFSDTGALVSGTSTGASSATTASKTGWQQEGNDWFFYEANGTKKTGWLKSEGYWYYLKSNGAMATRWVDDGGQKYYLNPAKDSYGPKGAMTTGWRSIEGTEYYFNKGRSPEGALYYTGVTPIMGTSKLGTDKVVVVDKFVKMYESSKRVYPAAELKKGGAENIQTFCTILYEEAVAENIKPEVVFGQTMNETGYLQFGGDVKISQFNFAGIGATGNGVQGNSFKDVRTGLRAQVQHLKAYASDEKPVNAIVDPRYTYVKKGSAKYVEYLGIQENPSGGGWAAARNYGFTLMKSYINPIYSIK